MSWRCNVLNCGGGECVHRVTPENCALCGLSLVEVVTTGFRFCSNSDLVCEFEREAD